MTTSTADRTYVSWVVPLVALALGTFAIGTSEFVMMGISTTVARDFAVTESTAGMLITAYAAGVAVGAPLLVIMLVRVQRVTALLSLLALFCATHVLAAVAPTFVALVVARFLGGLPHGAYFGVAAVIGAAVVPKSKQGIAIATIFLGLTAANIVGVPVGTWLGQNLGWRSTFVAVAIIGMLALVAVFVSVSAGSAPQPTSLRSEFTGLLNRHSLLTILTVTIGFAGLFSVYAYIAPLMIDVSGFGPASIPWILSLVGVGFTVGNLLGGWLTDRSLRIALFGGLSVLAIALASLPTLADNKIGILIAIFVIGMSSFAAEPPIQKRLIDQAPDAPTLASATNQSAFNIANGLGAGVGGMVIATGASIEAVGYVGAVFVVTGICIAAYSFVNERHD